MLLINWLKLLISGLVCVLAIACSDISQKTVQSLTEDIIGQPTEVDSIEEAAFSPPPAVLNKLTWADFEPEMDASDTLQASLWFRIQKGLTFEVNPNHPQVSHYIRQYRAYPAQIQALADRAAPFLYLIVESVEKRNMPMEIALLPIVESAFDPFSVSQMGATGIWQIMPKTGTQFGLKQDWWFDGRRDIPGSTEVALNYLQYLNDMFQGDWMLALAAYNSGEGTVKKAMMHNRRANKKVDFFSLNLPKETRNYVPKMLALAYVVKHAHEFNVHLPSTENEAFLQQVTLDKQIDLALAAELAQIDLKALYHYNPGYTRWATHPKGPHHLLLPIKNAKTLQKSLSSLDGASLTKWHRYQVKTGDTLANIATLYRTTSAAIKEANQIKKEALRVGQYLLIPSGENRGQVNFTTAFHRNDHLAKKTASSTRSAPPPSSTTAAAASSSSFSSSVHVVRKGDSLWSISKQYGISLKQLASLNEISPQSPLKPGQRLVLSISG